MVYSASKWIKHHCIGGIMNCGDFKFSQKLSDTRIERAKEILGAKIVDKILAFALFLLGMDRTSISNVLRMKPGSLRSLINAINKRGLVAMEDLRYKFSSFNPPRPKSLKPSLSVEDEFLKVDFGINSSIITLPHSHPVLKRVILLTLLNHGFVSRSALSQVLNLSEDRIAKLALKLKQQDVPAIFEKRKGQQKNYRVTTEATAEVIQQFVLDVVNCGQTSGEQLAKNLAERCNITLSPRSILYHLSSLGLSHIVKSLPENLEAIKKKSLLS